MRELSALENQALSTLLANETVYAKESGALMKEALDDMRIEMSKIYEKYSVDGKLTLADMTKYNRYQSMENEMLDILDPALKANVKTIKRLMPEQYQASFFNYAWVIDNATGIRLSWGVFSPLVFTEALSSNFVKISLERYGIESRLAVRSALLDGLMAGKSYTQMIKGLKNTINTSYYKLLRILRTEGQTVINAGQNDAYLRALEMGIRGEMIWDATLDGRTRPTHPAMDGKKKQADGLFNGPGSERAPYPGWEGLSAGERIHCRCRERMQIIGYEPQLRRTRDQGVIPYQTYPEWVKNYGPTIK